MEIRQITEAISAEDCKSAVHVRSSSWDDLAPSKVSYDEFGIPSTFPSWVSVPYAKFYCSSLGVSTNELQLISSSESEGQTEIDSVIDFHEILKP